MIFCHLSNSQQEKLGLMCTKIRPVAAVQEKKMPHREALLREQSKEYMHIYSSGSHQNCKIRAQHCLFIHGG